MRVYFPSYYKQFKCIADKCRHSCCIGWEIGVDAETMTRYNALADESVLSEIKDGCIEMTDDGRCPFLRRDGLCRLIVEYGDDYTSEICREHPRFYHRVGDRVEMGIGPSCEEACRLIFSSGYNDFCFEDKEIDPDVDTDYDTILHREKIYQMLHQGSGDVYSSLVKIADEYKIELELINNINESGVLSELELLDEGHRELIALGRVDPRTDMQIYYERFFAYLVFRHLSLADSYDNLRARLGFCILLTLILENGMAADDAMINELARIISEEIEYSEDNTADLIFEIECLLI